MLDVIICANFGVEKLRGLGNTRGQILEFPIEMAGHPYNSAAIRRRHINSAIISLRADFSWEIDFNVTPAHRRRAGLSISDRTV